MNALIDGLYLSFCTYVTDKRIRVAIPSVGIAFRLVQLAFIIGYLIVSIRSGKFLLSKEVQGGVEVFGSNYDPAVDTDVELSPTTYCDNSIYDYTYLRSSDYFYVQPKCEGMNLFSINIKRENYISFSTVFMEYQEFSWPCGSSDARVAEYTSKCNKPVVTTFLGNQGQCGCRRVVSKFTKAVEENFISVTSTYRVNNLYGESWGSRSDTREEDDDDSHDIKLRVENTGLEIDYRHDQPFRVQLKELLSWGMATIDGVNVPTLDDYNTFQYVDEDTGQYPTYRMTGINLKVQMEYTNRQGVDPMTGSVDKNVDVTMKVTTDDEPGWASAGPRTFYIDYPEGPMGTQFVHRVIQYPQDIVVEFFPSGRARNLPVTWLPCTIDDPVCERPQYHFDPVEFIGFLIDAVVLMGIVKIIFDIIVFNFLPGGVSLVLANKRIEMTSRNRAFAELGLKAAVSVNQFHKLDQNKRGKLAIADLVRVFGGVEHVDHNKALMIARTVFRLADKDKQGINFNEFMSLTEGDAIQFEQFLKYVSRTGNLSKVDLKDREEAVEAYQKEEQAVLGIRLDDDDDDDDPPPVSAPRAPTQATPPQPTAPVAPQMQQMPFMQQQVQVMAPPQVVAPPQVMAPPQPRLPPGVMKVMCYNCRRPFGVPVGASAVQCPHCRTVNKLR